MGTNGVGCTEWERDFDPKTEQPYRAEIEGGRMSKTEFHFWMDARRFTSKSKRLTGAAIKVIADTNRLYPVYHDTMTHASNDEPVGDGELVDIDGKHFYSLIPATTHQGVTD